MLAYQLITVFVMNYHSQTKRELHLLSVADIFVIHQSKATLNYRVIVERYPMSNGVVDGTILVVKSSLFLTQEREKTNKQKKQAR